MENRNNGSFHEGTQNKEKLFEDSKLKVVVWEKESPVHLISSRLAISSG
jgi:hypothetical protein